MDDLENLEYLGLVSKIASEIENHIGVADKTLAEFVINTHAEAKGLTDFETKLKDVGAEFPRSLVESIDRLILTLHPKYKKGAAPAVRDDDDDDDDKSRKARVFRGLAIPDKEVDDPTMNNPLDDAFAELEDLATLAPSKSTQRRDKPADRQERSRDRRSRSRSPYERSRKSHRQDRGYEMDFGDADFRGESRYSSRKRDRDGDTAYRSSKKIRSDDDEFRRPPTPELDDEPVLYKIYDGRVKTIKDFGAFVFVEGLKRPQDGLVHVSQLTEGRVNHPSDLVSRGQPVKVKVIKVDGTKISLSMKEVDQRTGHDLAPSARITGANMQALGTSSAVPVVEDAFSSRRNGMRKRMTSPERWEIKQLIASGVLQKKDYPDIDRDNVDEEGRFEEEEEVEIELTEEEPIFLKGQTQKSLELSPIRIVKNPEGSLARGAQNSLQAAQERRELRQQEAQEKAAKEAEKVDLSSQWNDPLAKQRQFASDIRNARKDLPPEPVRKMPTNTRRVQNRTDLSMKEQRESLPVFKFRSQFLEAISANQVLIVVGQTGSGKTTQLAQYLAENGLTSENTMIGCTQPRRIAAQNVAKRVAEECGAVLGREVGYTVRFDDKTSPDTKIKFMTDGILLTEMLADPMLSRYSAILIDEAHERTISTDVIMGLFKSKTLKLRPDLKLIVTSATLDSASFSKYYNAPEFHIPGRTFPVEIMYSREPCDDYLEEALTTVIATHLEEGGLEGGGGDILVFLTGEEEINTGCQILEERMKALGDGVPELIILPLYAALPEDLQARVFIPAPPGSRKVILSTNIAETSLTIDGVFVVIDSGMEKTSSFDPRLQMDRLQVTPISQASAKQRAGRAGRTRAGRCLRLYTEAAYEGEMTKSAVPDIQRANLSSTILTLKAMGINDLLNFPFLDPPPAATMLQALEELYNLGFLDDDGFLTRSGRRSSAYPTSPALAKTLIKSAEMQCSDEVLTIASMISGTDSVFYRPRDKAEEANKRKARFNDSTGDHLTYLNVYRAWQKSGFADQFCHENFIKPRNLRSVQNIRKQLLEIMQRQKLPIVSCGSDTTRVRKAFASGYFRNTARKDQEGYKTLVEGTPVYLHPGSALFGKNAEMIMYLSILDTSKEWMTLCSVIEPKWLPEVAPSFFKVAPKNQLSKRQKAERIQPLHNRFAGEDDWRLSAQKRAGRGGGGTWG
ncbi:P-loop containing nucleoside triphosphate hydrolase protein [Byssothecium circinans]|uniref:RNA helicase n=1 Tax=Byssothecium circinans TaxID=147558 RepID=A0A6A5TSG1_9PLEO|nr:P-loop containing nucleoside triphosphate hydrolase protein [Byssothecium circinans]